MVHRTGGHRAGGLPHHLLDDLIGENLCGSHSADGDWYYGITIAVDPGYRRLGIGHQLYIRRKDLVRRFAKAGIGKRCSCSRMSHREWHRLYSDYVDKVVAGELYDPTLSFQLKNGFEALGAIPDYMDDPAVGDNAVLIVWRNPDLADPA